MGKLARAAVRDSSTPEATASKSSCVLAGAPAAEPDAHLSLAQLRLRTTSKRNES
jgi:hypothetical protein